MIQRMASLRSSVRSLLPALVGILLLHGVLTLVPHRHGMETVRTIAELTDHWCGSETTEAFPIAEVRAVASCLACAVQAPACDRSCTLPMTGIEPSAIDQPQSTDQFSTPARRWRHQLRAPPSSV